MPEITKFISLENLSLYDEKSKALMDAKDTEILEWAKAHAEDLSDIYDAAGSAATAESNAKEKVEELATYVGTIPEGYTQETVIAYVDKKAEETLSAAQGGSSETAASVKQALDTYKAENDPKVSALEGDVATIKSDYLKGSDKEELEKAIADETTRADLAEKANAAAAKAADDKAVAAQEDVDILAAKVGEVSADRTVVQMISDAQTAATYDDTQVKADIKANADAIDVLNGTGAGSVDKKITDAFNDFSTKVTDDSVVNSYKELIDWAAEHGGEAAEMADAITTLQNIVAGIGGEGQSATVVAYVTAAIDALKIEDYAKAADLLALAERVAAMEAKVTEWDAAQDNAVAAAAADATQKANAARDAAKAYADAEGAKIEARVETLETASATHALASDLTTANGKIAAAEGEIDTLQSEMDAVKAKAAANEAAVATKADQSALNASNERIDAVEAWQANIVVAETSDIEALFATATA